MIFIDSEGEPVQEFSAIYVHEQTYKVMDVFHRHVQYPSPTCDEDKFARFHVHGLDISYLSLYGLSNEEELLCEFKAWLKYHPFTTIYANAPSKEEKFLKMTISDVHLKPWQERSLLSSHQCALFMKMNAIPICDTVCNAHTSFKGWKPKRAYSMSLTDAAKMEFFHHCSLYDSIECLLFYTDSDYIT